MPPSDALDLDGNPRAAADARQWVSAACADLDRTELVETAQMGVSELVSNALLHGRPPIRLKVRGTASHPRFEVHDGSPVAPVPPGGVDADDDEAEFLSTFGRGLAIVSLCSVAWGASMENDGKVVWFEPSDEMREDGGVPGVFDTSFTHEVAVDDGETTVVLLGFDVAVYLGLKHHYAELRRELRLLALAHEETYPLARDLSEMFDRFDAVFPAGVETAVRRARKAAIPTVDLTINTTFEMAELVATMLEMFELADAFCRAERLLSMQRTPVQKAFHTWLLTEIVRQQSGELPLPWQGRASDRVSNAHVS